MIMNMELLEKKTNDVPDTPGSNFENPYEQLIKMYDAQKSKFCVVRIGGIPKSILESLRKE
jgi:hypothetical protein